MGLLRNLRCAVEDCILDGLAPDAIVNRIVDDFAVAPAFAREIFDEIMEREFAAMNDEF